MYVYITVVEVFYLGQYNVLLSVFAKRFDVRMILPVIWYFNKDNYKIRYFYARYIDALNISYKIVWYYLSLQCIYKQMYIQLWTFYLIVLC